MTYKSLDLMVEHGAWRMCSDPWYREDVVHLNDGGMLSVGLAWKELSHIQGQIDYQGETFVVSHQNGRQGMGGMDEGSPPSITVYRIKREGK